MFKSHIPTPAALALASEIGTYIQYIPSNHPHILCEMLVDLELASGLTETESGANSQSQCTYGSMRRCCTSPVPCETNWEVSYTETAFSTPSGEDQPPGARAISERHVSL